MSVTWDRCDAGPTVTFPHYTAWWRRHICVWTTCPGLHSTARRPGFEPETCWSQVQQPLSWVRQSVRFQVIYVSATNTYSYQKDGSVATLYITKNKQFNNIHLCGTGDVWEDNECCKPRLIFNKRCSQLAWCRLFDVHKIRSDGRSLRITMFMNNGLLWRRIVVWLVGCTGLLIAVDKLFAAKTTRVIGKIRWLADINYWRRTTLVMRLI